MTSPWGTTVSVYASSAAPDADPVWVDLSDYVSFRNGPLTCAGGQQTDLEGTDPATAALAWRNDGHEFTDPSGLFPWFKEARRVRVDETVGAMTFNLFDGYLGPPTQVPDFDTVAGVAALTTAATAADRLSRLRNARPFVSNLTAHIRCNAGTALRAYWPLTGQPPFTSLVGAAFPTTFVPYSPFNPSLAGAPSGSSSFTPSGTPGPAGEDVSFAEYDLEFADVGGISRVIKSWSTGAALSGLSLTAGQVMTLVAWVYIDDRTIPFEGSPISIFYTDPTVGVLTLVKQDPGVSVPTWLADSSGGTLASTSIPGGVVPTGRWTLTALRFGFTPNVFQLWVDDVVTTGTLTGSAPTTLVPTAVWMPQQSFAGAIAHVQLYIGAASDWDFADFTAQRQAGLTGLERQTTGQRVNTILDYAGVPASIRDVDPGVAVMSAASLAGKDPLTLLEEARRTERGRLFMADGRLKFHDRTRVFNV